MGDRYIPIIDEDKLDDIITALQSLAAPSGTNVAISPTGMHIVTEDDVQGAISELDAKAYEINSSLTQFGYYTLLNGESVSNTRTSKTLYNDRKLSDYKSFLAVIRVGASAKISMLLPKLLFQSGSDQMSLFYVDSGNTQRWFEITYNSDTAVYIQSSANVATNTTVWLYGMKF